MNIESFTSNPMLVMLVMLVMVAGLWFCYYGYREHRQRRRMERTCRFCGAETTRVYKMIHEHTEEARRLQEYCQWHIFDVCTDNRNCGRVLHVNHGVKWFSAYKLFWRWLTNQSQFKPDEELFKKANLIVEVVPSLAERMRLYDVETSERIRRLREANEQVSHVKGTQLSTDTVRIIGRVHTLSRPPGHAGWEVGPECK